MRYRTLSVTGDYVFGQGPAQFLIDSPETVAQAVKTRLALALSEWFLDQTDGTPYASEILGTGTQASYDVAVQERILNTPGVTSIDSYVSVLDRDRKLSINVTISTIYGAITIGQVL